MTLRNFLICSACIAGMGIFAAAETTTLTSDPAYEKNCAKCHGKTAEGRHFGGPSLVKSDKSEAELKTIIAKGKGHMPKYAGKLTDDEIAKLAAEITALSAK